MAGIVKATASTEAAYITPFGKVRPADTSHDSCRSMAARSETNLNASTPIFQCVVVALGYLRIRYLPDTRARLRLHSHLTLRNNSIV